jgi:hypothetical protein
MAKKHKKLTDEEILTAVQANIDDSIGFSDSKLSKERQRVLNYYHGALPLPAHSGNSKYVSMDVYDTVESMKASLLETFSAGYNIVEFTPQDEDDVRGARIASLYTDYVVFRQNCGYQLFSDIITDGLLARNGVAKVYWEKEICYEDEVFGPVAPEDMDALISEEDVELKDYELDEDGTVSGTITRTVDKSQVRIIAVPPEEFIISARAKTGGKDEFKAHRLVKTVSELLKMGVSQEKIDKMPRDDGLLKEQEEQARLQDLGADATKARKDYQDQVRDVRVHESYIMLDVEGTGIAKLWKVVSAGDVLIEKEEVDRDPFLFFVPLPIPHSFFGSNFASKVIPIQNARSILVRGILDHTVITNNPRTMVVKGALVNPKEMLENRIGGVVNVTRPDGVFPYPQSSLNPYVFQTINLLDEDKEDTTGISKLSQGLNKDAVSNQNSQGLVENLVGLSQQRQKIVARNFANSFLTKLYLEAYRLVLENETKKNILDLAGDWVEIDVANWVERKDVFTSLKLGYGEQGKEGAKLLQLHTLMSSDPSLAPFYPATKKYNVLRSMIEKEGVKNVSDYIVKPPVPGGPPNPEWVEPTPDPKMVAEIEALKAKAAALTGELDLAKMTAQHEIALSKANHELEKKNALIDMLMSQREQERKDYETKNRAAIAERELDIMETAVPEKTNQSLIVSPNS